MLVEEFLDAESVFGRNDSDAGAGVLQCSQYGLGFQEKHRVDSHMRIGLFSVFCLESCQLSGICHAGEYGKRVFQSLADSTFDVVIRHLCISVAGQYVAETSDDSAGRISKRIVKVEKIGRVIHCDFLWQR